MRSEFPTHDQWPTGPITTLHGLLIAFSIGSRGRRCEKAEGERGELDRSVGGGGDEGRGG